MSLTGNWKCIKGNPKSVQNHSSELMLQNTCSLVKCWTHSIIMLCCISCNWLEPFIFVFTSAFKFAVSASLHVDVVFARLLPRRIELDHVQIALHKKCRNIQSALKPNNVSQICYIDCLLPLSIFSMQAHVLQRHTALSLHLYLHSILLSLCTCG